MAASAPPAKTDITSSVERIVLIMTNFFLVIVKCYVGSLPYDMKAILIVAIHLASLLVIKKRIKRMALVGPHL